MKNWPFMLQIIRNLELSQIQSEQISPINNSLIDLEFELQYRVFTNKGERIWHKKIYLN